MTIGFWHGDSRFPFFCESVSQPPARWHGPGGGPVRYLADTSDGAWAEFLRHEEIVDVADLAGIERRVWAVELPADVEAAAEPDLPDDVRYGDEDSWARCRAEAERLAQGGATALRAPSAALEPGGACGQITSAAGQEGPARDGVVWVLTGRRPDLRGWVVAAGAAPGERVLGLVRHFGFAPPPGTGERRRRVERRSGSDRRQLVDLTRADRGEPERRRDPRDRRGAGGRRAGDRGERPGEDPPA